MFYALNGDKKRAFEPVAGLNTRQQEFLRQQVYALLTLLPATNDSINSDNSGTPTALASWQRRASLAGENLQQAADLLGMTGGLAVRNLHFCTDIKGFGVYTPFAKEVFRPGQEVLLYAELNNFTSESADKGEHTRFTARYQIHDKQGNQLVEKELGTAEEFCRNRRHDYFVLYHLWMPQQVNPGEYSIKLQVEDTLGGLFGETTLAFKIGEAGEGK